MLLRAEGRLIAGLAALGIAAVLIGAHRSPANPSLDDPVDRLAARIDRGEVELTFDAARGWLPSLLGALDVSVESQILVFSRTSLQTDLISPWTPRALYFGDDVYVGWVPDSPIVEIAVVDPEGAAAFYTLAQDPERPPTFRRESTTCLMCHESRAVTGGVPGFIVRSVLTDRFGYPVVPLHEGSTTDRTDFELRFGGYYVTGSHGTPGHAGNVYAPVRSHEVVDPERTLHDVDLRAGGGALQLDDRFDLAPYPSPHSDLVALMVLTHQAHVHNLIAAARAAGAEARRLESLGGQLPPSTRQRNDGAVERLLRAMLFVDEAPLHGPVRGTSGFAERFEARGPFDAEGRSLRTLDLETRLFRYRLSFLVHSDAFQTLPESARSRFYRRLDAVLRGEDPGAEWSHLGEEERRTLGEILADTEPEFAALRR
ncbi:MAG: hypothetical protein RLN75_04555 [Longimicrobiales bacterium]